MQSRRLDLPSLTAIRAFEVAARRQSFKDAADELCVTPAAISRQIKQLEAQLATVLFVRGHRQVTLTAAGSGCSGLLILPLMKSPVPPGKFVVRWPTAT
ncbi:LysR family transcriptional regulator [Aliamphritea spongicola]|nr:LysR family transcriptional regulator [Aliamphritea spongicola]